MADEDDLDALLDEAANDVLNDQDADDMLDDVLDDVLGGESTAKMDTSPARSATRAPPKSECERLQDSLRAVLPAEVASRWAIVVKDDETRMANAFPPRPPSRAYRSLNSRGQAGANTKEEKAAGEHSLIPPSARAINELLLRAAFKAGIKDTEPLRKALAADTSNMKTLQELFMKQMLVDLKEVVAEDPDFDPKRFPCTAQRVLE